MGRTVYNPINILYSFMLVFDVLLMGLYPVVKGTIIESYIMYALWGMVFGIICFSVIKDFKLGTKSGFAYCLIIVLLLMYNIIFSNGKKSDLTIAALSFFVMFFPFYYTQHMNKSEALVSFIERCTIVKALIFIVYSFTSYAYAGFYVDGEYIKNGQLTLGYANPNTAAIYLFSTFAILLCLFNFTKNESKVKKFGIVLLLLLLAYLLMCTGSRLEIGCMVIVLLLRYFWNRRILKKLLTSNLFLAIVIILPLTFLWAYFKFYTIFPDDYTVMGRGVFSRISIYQDSLTNFKDNILFGNMPKWLFENSHNGLLTIMINLGIVGLIIYLLFLYKNVRRYAMFVLNNKHSNPVPYFMVIAFLVQACAESSSLAGGVSFMYSVAVATYLCEMNGYRLDIQN